jgi:hypothetical protein
LLIVLELSSRKFRGALKFEYLELLEILREPWLVRE